MRIIKWISKFIKKYIIDDCPLSQQCFDCDAGKCEGCKIEFREDDE